MSTFLLALVPLLFIRLNLFLSKKNNLNQEKSTPFECGFDPISLGRFPFRIQFFLIRLIFLIFDIEIVLLIPLIIMISSISFPMIIISLIFLIVLILGLYFEYLENSLEWKQ